jgi:hypothetical protein
LSDGWVSYEIQNDGLINKSSGFYGVEEEVIDEEERVNKWEFCDVSSSKLSLKRAEVVGSTPTQSISYCERTTALD